jgi:hypothetical protein
VILRIKNWSSFQHYKERNPPWIKLHKSLLDDYEYQSLPIASKALAPMLWLLASENKEGVINASDEKLAFRLRMAVHEFNEALKPLIDSGFVVLESEMLAECKRDAMPETEKSTETEEETEATDWGLIILKICQPYPGCKYRNEFEIPPIVSNAVGRAINHEHGQWWLLEGYAKAYADSKPDPKFVMSIEKFFGDPNKYRREWPSGGNKQISRLEQLEALRAADEQASEQLDKFDVGLSGRQDTRTGVPKTV